VLRGDLARSCGAQHQFAAIRPEQIQIQAGTGSNTDSGQVNVTGTLVDIQFHGASNHYEVDVHGQMVKCVIANRDDVEWDFVQTGQTVSLNWSRHLMISLES